MNRTLNVVLWILQVLFGLFFVGASGAPKFFAPQEVLNMPIVLPREFLIFIGTCEIAGGLGLILPGLLRIRTGVTPIAAFMLVLLTGCATVYQLLAGQVESAIFAVAVGAICATIAYCRWRVVPLQSAAPRPALAPVA